MIAVAAPVPSSHSGIPVRSLWLLAGVTVCWGVNWPLMKMVLFEWNVWHFRTVGLALGCASLFALAKAMGHSLRVPAGEWGRLAGAAFLNITCWHIFSGFGVSLLPSGRASIIGYTMPLWMVPLSMWLLREPMSRRKLFGLALGFLGLLLLIGEDLFRLHRAPLGTLAMLAAAFTWAIGIVFMKRFPVALPTTVFTGWMLLLGGIPVLVGTVLFGGWDFRPLSGKALLALVYVIFVAMVFCHWGFMRLVQLLPATVTGVSSLGVPVVGVFSGMLMLGEKPGPAEWAALLLILGALAVILLPSKPNRQAPAAAPIIVD